MIWLIFLIGLVVGIVLGICFSYIRLFWGWDIPAALDRQAVFPYQVSQRKLRSWYQARKKEKEKGA